MHHVHVQMLLTINKNMEVDSRKWKLDILSDENIKDYFLTIIDYADSQTNFYREGQKDRKCLSNIFLIVAIVAFAISLILPLMKGPDDKIFDSQVSYYSVSYLSLVIAGVFLLFDRLFGHSEAWMRYTLAKMQLDKVVAEFHGKWIQLIQGFDLANPSLEQKNQLMMTLLAFDNTLREVVIGETESWKTLFSEQIKEFNKQVGEKLKESREELESNQKEIKKNIDKKNEEERKKEFRGSLILSFNKKEKDVISILLSGKNKNVEITLEAHQYSKSFIDLEYGIYEIRITSDSENSKKTIEKIVLINEESTKEETFELK